jgi:protein TonB
LLPYAASLTLHGSAVGVLAAAAGFHSPANRPESVAHVVVTTWADSSIHLARPDSPVAAFGVPTRMPHPPARAPTVEPVRLEPISVPARVAPPTYDATLQTLEAVAHPPQPASPVAITTPPDSPIASAAESDDPPGPSEPLASGSAAASSPVAASSNRPPRYPEDALRERIEGIVRVQVGVGRDGSVTDATVLSTSGHQELDAAALEAVRAWRFQPARLRGVPVVSRVVVPIRFVCGVADNGRPR